jgi:hypothetical protein
MPEANARAELRTGSRTDGRGGGESSAVTVSGVERLAITGHNAERFTVENAADTARTGSERPVCRADCGKLSSERRGDARAGNGVGGAADPARVKKDDEADEKTAKDPSPFLPMAQRLAPCSEPAVLSIGGNGRWHVFKLHRGDTERYRVWPEVRAALLES